MRDQKTEEEKMKILLVQIDGKMPNLALMKISSYHKRKGDSVGWAWANPDRVYISCIFSQNLPHARGVAKFYPEADVRIGGPALGYPNSLPDEIEHSMPDYSLYPDLDYSMGFTTRGCIRNCPFCIVPRIEGYFRENDHPSLFCNPDFNKVMLLDNNLLASRFLFETLEWIRNQGLKVCFTQGLDARLVTEKIASILADMKAYNFHFKHRTYYFAWDLMESEKEVLRGLKNMLEVGVHPRCLMIYMLVGFNTTHEQDYYRFKKLTELGMDPFVMTYNNRRDDPWIRHFARWVNRRRYKICDFDEYNRLTPLQRNETESIMEAYEIGSSFDS